MAGALIGHRTSPPLSLNYLTTLLNQFMAKLLITGADGQVGQELRHLATHDSRSFHFTSRNELDITNAAAIDAYFERVRPDYCLNCAAYTAVDRAESEAELAARINTEGAVNLASACLRYSTRMLHLSTDYVYHNDWNRPLTEDAPTSPRGVYAKTKLSGDEIVRRLLPDASVVLRTSWVYSSFGNNFVKTMLRLGAERDELGIIYDQIGSPTYARDLAAAMLRLTESDAFFQSGIYHYSNEGVCSWYDFAHAIFEMSGTEVNLRPILTTQYPTPAERPPFSLLAKEKFRATFDMQIPYWRDSLRRCLGELGVLD